MAKTETSKVPKKGIVRRMIEQFKNDQAKGAYTTMAEELFQDYYNRRHDVYKMNFIRGIFFGLGSVIGGTVVVALLIWILSLFINFPLIGQYFENVQMTVEQSQPSDR